MSNDENKTQGQSHPMWRATLDEGVILGFGEATSYEFTQKNLWKKPWPSLYGAAIGDICGSIYEFNNYKTDHPEEIELIDDRCFFTDDTVLTAAVATIVKELGDLDFDHLRQVPYSEYPDHRGRYEARCDAYSAALWDWGNRYRDCSYGGRFYGWLNDSSRPKYDSYGNGAAMRCSPVAWTFCEHHRKCPAYSGMGAEYRQNMYLGLIMDETLFATEPTHGHSEGVKGAKAVSWAMYFAWAGESKEAICKTITREFSYDLSKTLAEIRPMYQFDETCQGTVPVAIIAFLESHDFVSAIQNAISVGGDSDTIAAITGSIAEAYYRDIPEDLKAFARSKLPDDIQVALGMKEADHIQ